MDSPARSTWARLVSDILSPPVVWGVLAFPIAMRDAPTSGQALLWAGVYVLLVCLLPVVYIGLMVRRGSITDLHMGLRHQRLLPLLVSLSCTATAWIVLRLLGAPPVVPLFALFSLIQLTMMALITLIWQISIHAISISGATITTGVLFGLTPGLITVPLILLVGAARLRLRRHTMSQVIAGTAVGIASAIALFCTISIP